MAAMIPGSEMAATLVRGATMFSGTADPKKAPKQAETVDDATKKGSAEHSADQKETKVCACEREKAAREAKEIEEAALRAKEVALKEKEAEDARELVKIRQEAEQNKIELKRKSSLYRLFSWGSRNDPPPPTKEVNLKGATTVNASDSEAKAEFY